MRKCCILRGEGLYKVGWASFLRATDCGTYKRARSLLIHFRREYSNSKIQDAFKCDFEIVSQEDCLELDSNGKCKIGVVTSPLQVGCSTSRSKPTTCALETESRIVNSITQMLGQVFTVGRKVTPREK